MMNDATPFPSDFLADNNPLGRNSEGEHNIFSLAGGAVTITWAFTPTAVRGTATVVTTVYGAMFDAGGQASDGNFKMRDGFELAGGVLGGFAGLLGGGGIGSAFLGIAGSQAGGYLGGELYDLMFDSGATPIQPMQVIVEQARQSRITSNDSGMQARYDNPQYDAQTADGKGVTRAYVDAYAQGDLKTAAQFLVDHGANIYPDAKNGFYADQIILQMAGYAGGITPTANQILARDMRDAMGSDGDPNTYPDAIIRVVAAPKSHSNGSSNDSHTTVHSTIGFGYQGKSSDPPSGGKPSTSTGNSKVDTNHLAKVVEGKVRSGLPVVLDLDGSGIEITPLGQSTQHIIGADGLLHRTAWAGAGDGVLFVDADGDGNISNLAEYVFTEWDRTASDDMEAIRRVFDTDGDGKLTEADARWGEFRVMVTNADGTTTAKTLAELGITEINLRPDVTRITLPDGSQHGRSLISGVEQMEVKRAA